MSLVTSRMTMKEISDLDRDKLMALLENAAKNWLAHDGLWFQAVEERFDLETAMELDGRAWEKFTVVEARRIMQFLGLEQGGGIPALAHALDFRLYALLNVQEVVDMSDTRCIFHMRDCRVQAARRRKGLPDFPCKQVGIIEYSGFARTIDPRIRTRCITCPPDHHPEDTWCSWEFTMEPE